MTELLCGSSPFGSRSRQSRVPPKLLKLSGTGANLYLLLKLRFKKLCSRYKTLQFDNFGTAVASEHNRLCFKEVWD